MSFDRTQTVIWVDSFRGSFELPSWIPVWSTQWTIGMVHPLCSLTVYRFISRLVLFRPLAPLGACMGFGLDLLPSLVSVSPAVCAPLLRLLPVRLWGGQEGPSRTSSLCGSCPSCVNTDLNWRARISLRFWLSEWSYPFSFSGATPMLSCLWLLQYFQSGLWSPSSNARSSILFM